MIKSMTAYGRATSREMNGLYFVVEIHSVNRKMLDLQLHLSKELLFLDVALRKFLAKEIDRGQVTIKITFRQKEGSKISVSLLKKMKTHFEKVAEELGYRTEEIDFSFLLSHADTDPLEGFGLSEKEMELELKKTLSAALIPFNQMKKKEGAALKKDIKSRLKILTDMTEKIKKCSEQGTEKYRKKLLDRLKKVQEISLEDERVLKEVALFAEKVDITEEIIRLTSHFAQANALFTREESVGRTLDFLVQECLREINTIASKSADLEITKLSVEVKAELEKIREQVQNIE